MRPAGRALALAHSWRDSGEKLREAGRALFRATINAPGLSSRFPMVEVACADCGCIVDSRVVVVPCGAADCCCKHLPVRP